MNHDQLVSLLERERIPGLVAELRGERLRQEKTQEQVAAATHVDVRHIQRCETGRSHPSAMVLAAWARALGYELALYEPAATALLAPPAAALLDEVIDVLAKALLGQDDN